MIFCDDCDCKVVLCAGDPGVYCVAWLMGGNLRAFDAFTGCTKSEANRSSMRSHLRRMWRMYCAFHIVYPKGTTTYIRIILVTFLASVFAPCGSSLSRPTSVLATPTTAELADKNDHIQKDIG